MLAVVAMSTAAFANQSDAINAAVVNLPPTGDAGRIRCQLLISSRSSVPLWVEIPAFRSPLGYVVNASPTRISLSPRQETLVELQIGLAADGKYQVLIPLVVRDAQGQGKHETSADAYFEVQRGRYTQSSYRALFVNPIALEHDEKGRLVQLYPAGAPPAGWRDEPESKTPRTDVEELERMQRSTVFETDWSQGPTQRSSKQMSRLSDDAPEASPAELQFKPDEIPDALSGVTATALGTLKYTSMNGTLRPCYGWRVVAYTKIGGAKIPLATGYVKSNGNWKLTFVPLGTPVKIEYQPENAFFSFADPADNTYYSFSSGIVYHPAGGDTINEYSQAVYLANSSLVGLGELYRDGMLMWDALKTKGGGISPLRDESIVIYYPNTSYNCGLSMPWSCAVSSGFIWIIPAHASNRDVMSHELAHQMNFEYWDGGLPGGPHALWACINPDLALVEGFANFMSKWVRFSQTDTPSDDVESPPLLACLLPTRNELRVAATFWDLYDVLEDGDDEFAFSHQGAPVGIYLKSGPQNNMGAYRLPYKLATLPANHAKIEAIFDQNWQ